MRQFKPGPTKDLSYVRLPCPDITIHRAEPPFASPSRETPPHLATSLGSCSSVVSSTISFPIVASLSSQLVYYILATHGLPRCYPTRRHIAPNRASTTHHDIRDASSMAPAACPVEPHWRVATIRRGPGPSQSPQGWPLPWKLLLPYGRGVYLLATP
ncbi:uncharacterized protein K452DRAFT_101834 [Aplosporella prunicola CBS 121167]|uniref:Uncharacterized protein n=1 Tax=Aplosporella prunicola CBS 121167 TaxID=1176127 RepID=A0A6A6AZZ3_9PEZI|nr:uncharacterized protein K452DRAFT_101834 [Aplosporella prunicola CBS 121167]KAF2137512.1 hypothetical protein K452DRAFT_101834 [Aplosporella prunicola CBS 121167]